VLESDAEVDWKRIQYREDIGKEFTIFFPTLLQRMFEVTGVIDAIEDLIQQQATGAQIAEAWATHVSQSSKHETVGTSFVEAVILIRRRVTSNKKCLQLLLEADDEFGTNSPWQSVYTIEAIAKKVGVNGDMDNIHWIIASVNYAAKTGYLDKTNMSIRSFSGKGQPNNKGYCDVLMFKFEAKRHFLSCEMPKLHIPLQDCETISQKMECHDAYARTVAAGNTWVGLMSETAQLFYTFVTELVYGVTYDHIVKESAKNGASCADITKDATKIK
jgi:hypothetical protein